MDYKLHGRGVGNIGFGLLGLTWRTTPISDEEAIITMKAALEAGCNYWNAGEFYGTSKRNSMTLLNKYFERYPEDADRVVINVKGCSFENFRPDSSPAAVKESIENSLRMLGPRGRIDEFEPARKDPNTPIEVAVGAIDEFVKAGKIGGVALSEVSAETIRRAAKVTKIAAVEVEISLWSTEPLTNGIAEACAELDIPIIAYSPLGRGIMTGAIKSLDDLPQGDFRRFLPRFQPDVLDQNLRLVSEVEKLAQKKGCTAAQIAINWVLAVSRRPGMPKMFPVPGAASVERVKENSKEIELTDEDMAEIEKLLETLAPVGDRYHKHGMDLLDKERL